MFDLPFTITQVLDLFPPLKNMSTSGSVIYATCPHCGGKTSFHVDMAAGLWNCPRCSNGGGILDLYCFMNNMKKSKDNRAIAYHDLAKLFGIENDRGQKIMAHKEIEKLNAQNIKKNVPQVLNSQLADVTVLDHTYRTLLLFLTLNAFHRSLLHKKGLSDEAIEKELYRSLPSIDVKKIIQALIDFGCILMGVPGFYFENGEIKMNINSKDSGFFVPYKNKEGFIVGLQIKHDNNEDGKFAKYTAFSSKSKNLGCGPGSPSHYIGEPFPQSVVLTEGALKATTSYYLAKKMGYSLTVCAIAGVTQFKSIRNLFDELSTNGCKTVYEALDMDRFKNPYVFKAWLKIRSIAAEYELNLVPFCWNAIEISKIQNGKLTFNEGAQYKIMNLKDQTYYTSNFGSTKPENIKDVFTVDQNKKLIVPEPIINAEHPHEDQNCRLINVETGEYIDFVMTVDKDSQTISANDCQYYIDNRKGLDDYYLSLVKAM